MKVHVYKTVVAGQPTYAAHIECPVRCTHVSVGNIGEFSKKVREQVWLMRTDHPRERVLLCFTPLADIVWLPGKQTPEESTALLTDNEIAIFTKIFVRTREEAARMAGLNSV